MLSKPGKRSSKLKVPYCHILWISVFKELPVITQLTCSHRAKDAIVVVAVEG